MLKVPLTKGFIALVDDDDREIIEMFKWSATVRNGRAYAVGYVRGSGRKERKLVYMHRILMNAPKGFDVDHINGNGLDNCKENLRIVSRSQNNMNAKVRGSIKYKGVQYIKRRNHYTATIKLNGKSKYLGSFKTAIEAAKCYNQHAIELFGEYAKINTFD